MKEFFIKVDFEKNMKIFPVWSAHKDCPLRAFHTNCRLLPHLLMYLSGLYCKEYGSRSDCSLQGLILRFGVRLSIAKIIQSCIINILTSTKNASLIITDFLAMIYKNEQPRTTVEVG